MRILPLTSAACLAIACASCATATPPLSPTPAADAVRDGTRAARAAAEAALRTPPPELLIPPEAPPPPEEGADPAAELLAWQAAWASVARQLNRLIDFLDRAPSSSLEP